MSTSEDVVIGEEVDESGRGNEPTRPNQSTREAMMDFLMENWEEIHEFVLQRRQAKEKQRQEAFKRRIEGDEEGTNYMERPHVDANQSIILTQI